MTNFQAFRASIPATGTAYLSVSLELKQPWTWPRAWRAASLSQVQWAQLRSATVLIQKHEIECMLRVIEIFLGLFHRTITVKIWQVQKGKGCLLAQSTPLSAGFPETPHTLLLTCPIWPHQDERKIRKHSWVHFSPNKTRVLVPKEQWVQGCWMETSRCFHRNPIRLFLQPFKAAASTSQSHSPRPSVAFATVHALKCWNAFLLSF